MDNAKMGFLEGAIESLTDDERVQLLCMLSEKWTGEGSSFIFVTSDMLDLNRNLKFDYGFRLANFSENALMKNFIDHLFLEFNKESISKMSITQMRPQ